MKVCILKTWLSYRGNKFCVEPSCQTPLCFPPCVSWILKLLCLISVKMTTLWEVVDHVVERMQVTKFS